MVVLGVVSKQIEVVAKPLLLPVLERKNAGPPKAPPGPAKTKQNEKQTQKRKTPLSVITAFKFAQTKNKCREDLQVENLTRLLLFLNALLTRWFPIDVLPLGQILHFERLFKILTCF